MARNGISCSLLLLSTALGCPTTCRIAFFDTKSGYKDQIISRSSTTIYYIAKYISTFISGALLGTVPLILNFYLTALWLPLATPDASSGLYSIFAYSMWSELFYSRPFLYIVCYLILIFTTSGLIACIPLSLSAALENKSIILCSGFFSCTILNYLFGQGEYAFLSPSTFMRPDQPVWGYDFAQIFCFLTLLALSELLSLKQMKGHWHG